MPCHHLNVLPRCNSALCAIDSQHDSALEAPPPEPDTEFAHFMARLNLFFTAFFFTEMVLKIIGLGFIGKARDEASNSGSSSLSSGQILLTARLVPHPKFIRREGISRTAGTCSIQ